MFKRKGNNRKYGFTLIELLVTISIIGILSSIVYGTFSGARAAARDDVRKTDLKNLQLAIDLYKAQHGVYPAQGCATTPTTWAGNGPKDSPFQCQSSNFIDGLVPDFIDRLPIDPKNESNSGYIYRSDGTSYKLLSFRSVEVKRISSGADEFARCPDISGTNCGGQPIDNHFITYGVYGGPDSANW